MEPPACAGPSVRGLRPCPLGKVVTVRKGRCPDCTLAARRELLQRRGALRRQDQDDEASRVRRIEMSTPPASTFDGQLQRLRDTRAEQKAAGESWWMQTPTADGFTAMAEARQAEMAKGKGARIVALMEQGRRE